MTTSADVRAQTDIPTDCDFFLDCAVDEETWGRKKKTTRRKTTRKRSTRVAGEVSSAPAPLSLFDDGRDR